MTLEEEVTRGREAELLLQNPLFAEAFDVLEREIEEKWKESPSRDVDGREKLYLMLKMTQRVRAHLKSLVASGKLAQRTLRERFGPSSSPF